MENISQDAIAQLVDGRPTAPAVTIYAPMHRESSPPNMTEDQIRFKNLIREVSEILKNRDDGKAVERELCGKLEELLDDKTFWEHQTEGLLVCSRPGALHMYHLPIDTEEYVAVDTHFHLAPVFSLLQDRQDYYAFVLAQQDPAIYSGDAYGLYPAGVVLPRNLAAALNIDEPNQRNVQQRSAGGSALNTFGYNGRGGTKDYRDNDRTLYFRYLDDILCDKLDSTKPLVIAGVESEIAEFRDISRYPKILSGAVLGSFGGSGTHDLFAKVFDVIRKEIINPRHTAAIESYERLRGVHPERIADTFAAITDAADDGRIDTLLIGMLRYTRDTVRNDFEPVARISFPGPEPSKVIHDTAYAVWNQGGSIINTEYEHMPETHPMLASLRY